MAKNKPAKPEVTEAPVEQASTEVAIVEAAPEVVQTAEAPTVVETPVVEPVVEAVEAVTEEAPKAKEHKDRKYRVPCNPTLVEWPTDIWGLTKDLKRAFLDLASRINGQEDKKALVDATLEVCLEFVEHRFDNDHTRHKNMLEKAERKELKDQLTLF